MSKLKYPQDINSIYNLRDMGGIIVDNGTIKHGMLYRSSEIGKITEEDKIKFDELHLDDIFDYRNDHEVKKCPDTYLSSASYHNIPAIEKDNAVNMTEEDAKKDIKHITKRKVDEYETHMANAYGMFVFNNDAIKETLNYLDQGKVILFHCVGGKDRTGLMAALILLSFGASEETVIKDYLLTNKYSKKRMNKLKVKIALYTFNLNAVRMVDVLGGAKRKYIETAFKEVHKKYKDMKEYLLKEYNVTDERVSTWRKYYVDNN